VVLVLGLAPALAADTTHTASTPRLAAAAPPVDSAPAAVAPAGPGPLDAALAEARSLRERAARLRAEAAAVKGGSEADRDRAEAAVDLADELEDLAGDLEDEIGDAGGADAAADTSGLRRELHAVRDTIVYVTKKGVSEFLAGFRGIRSSPRDRGFGASAAFSVQVLALDMKPVYDLFRTNPGLLQLGLPIYDSYETTVLLGGEGRAGVGHGIRIGGAGWGGHITRSATRTVTVDSAEVDSVYAAQIHVGHGGLLVEKAFVTSRFTWVLGGIFGGGALSVEIWRGTDRDILRRPEAMEDTDEEAAIVLESGYLYFELHGGGSVSILPWLHLGLDLTCPFFVSPRGFSDNLGRELSGSYFSFSPGARIRIVLGNIG